MDQLLVSNNLTYRLPSSLSVVVKRSGIKHYFDRTEYKGGQNAIVTLNGGDQYVDPHNSFMCFELGFEGSGANARVGHGAGLCNIIERVVVTSESGVEVSRFENCNNYHSVDARYRYSDNWIDSQGSMFAYPGKRDADGLLYVPDAEQDLRGVPGLENKYCIPMSMISPLFKTSQLLPGMGLMSGLKIEISFTDNATAFKYDGTSDGSTKFVVKNAYILTDSYMLSDAVLGSLNEQSAQNSLEIVWEESTHVQGAVANDVDVAIQDSKLAVSRAQSVWAKLRPQADISLITADSFSSSDDVYQRYQYRLAGLFFPNQPVETKTEMYHMALQNWDHHRNPHHGCSVNRDNFLNNASSALVDGARIMSTTLERSNVLSLSGLPIGSGRVLTLDAKLAAGAGASARLDMYVQYVKLARIYIDRVVVKS